MKPSGIVEMLVALTPASRDSTTILRGLTRRPQDEFGMPGGREICAARIFGRGGAVAGVGLWSTQRKQVLRSALACAACSWETMGGGAVRSMFSAWRVYNTANKTRLSGAWT
jgi:hypothetical protein